MISHSLTWIQEVWRSWIQICWIKWIAVTSRWFKFAVTWHNFEILQIHYLHEPQKLLSNQTDHIINGKAFWLNGKAEGERTKYLQIWGMWHHRGWTTCRLWCMRQMAPLNMCCNRIFRRKNIQFYSTTNNIINEYRLTKPKVWMRWLSNIQSDPRKPTLICKELIKGRSKNSTNEYKTFD